MAKKVKGKIAGDKVHEVGYRVLLLRKALELGIEKFNAVNTQEDPYQVVIFYIEADAEKLVEFQKFAGSNYPENAKVSDMAFEDYQGYVMNIVDYMHLIQVEQLSKGIPAILSIDKKQDNMLEKQDKMLEKQDETIAEIKQVSIKIDQGKEEIVSEIKSLRDDFRSRFDSRLERIEIDLAEIKVKVGIS